MTILYVDDDLDDQEFFCEALHLSIPRATCLLARDGEEGLKILAESEHQPDYIFTDLNMPNVNGIEFLGQVKASEHKHIPVIIFTTSNNPDHRIQAQKLGASRFVTKPNGVKQIVEMFKKLIE